MIAVGADILIVAVNRYAPEHARASALLESLANGERPWALPWTAVHSFLGFVTHPHAVARPLGTEDAWAFVEALSRSPSLRFLAPTERHAAACADVLRLQEPGGALEPGLATAVVLREHGVRELLSTDRGMRRWRFLDVRDPLHGRPWNPDERPARRYRTLANRGVKG